MFYEREVGQVLLLLLRKTADSLDTKDGDILVIGVRRRTSIA